MRYGRQNTKTRKEEIRDKEINIHWQSRFWVHVLEEEHWVGLISMSSKSTKDSKHYLRTIFCG